MANQEPHILKSQMSKGKKLETENDLVKPAFSDTDMCFNNLIKPGSQKLTLLKVHLHSIRGGDNLN